MLLAPLGYRVESFTNSLDALEAFKRDPYRFDLVITYMTMPVMTGEKLAEEILRIRPGMPIVLCTGHHPDISAKRAMEKGIRSFLMKPVLKDKLARAVREALELRTDKQGCDPQQGIE
jgi:DNA-binding NtrC family response regulator